MISSSSWSGRSPGHHPCPSGNDLIPGRPPNLGDPRTFRNRLKAGMAPRQRMEAHLRREALTWELHELDRSMVATAERRLDLLDELADLREHLWPAVPWQRGRRPPGIGAGPLPAATEGARPLAGVALRHACLQTLDRHGELPLVDIHAWLHRYGYLVAGAHPVKVLADALGHEHDAGRAVRIRRGVYDLAPGFRDRPRQEPGSRDDGDPIPPVDPVTDPPFGLRADPLPRSAPAEEHRREATGSGDESMAHAGLGEEVTGSGRVGLQPSSHRCHVHRQMAALVLVPLTPHGAEHHPTGHQPVGTAHQASTSSRSPSRTERMTIGTGDQPRQGSGGSGVRRPPRGPPAASRSLPGDRRQGESDGETTARGVASAGAYGRRLNQRRERAELANMRARATPMNHRTSSRNSMLKPTAEPMLRYTSRSSASVAAV